ncbi:MAG: tetratricopeptide repeat protein [Nitrospirota bacterium]|nr:tetratricopeptide repeat protein [Nitrospirota bacterium]
MTIMKAREFLEKGQLSEAIKEMTQEVKAHPADSRARTFLFELLCFSGDLNRAKNQLEALDTQDPKADLGIDFYRKVLKAEQVRQQLFSKGTVPKLLGSCPAHIQGHLDALLHIQEKNFSLAQERLSKAEELRPDIQGTIDGSIVGSFMDLDDLLAPILEMIMQDQYYWVPFSRIRKISLTPPKHLRDLLWAPVQVETTDASVAGVVPVLYPGSFMAEDELVKLGRVTDWKQQEGFTLGMGQHLYGCNDQDKGILEIREMTFAIVET